MMNRYYATARMMLVALGTLGVLGTFAHSARAQATTQPAATKTTAVSKTSGPEKVEKVTEEKAVSEKAAVEKTTVAKSELAKIDDGIGTITRSNVYVRAGSDRNYYPVMKLNQGDKVKIIKAKTISQREGDEYTWLEILPPPGSFSLVLKKQVDKGSGTAGTVNAEMVQVYAGSDLSKDAYAKQVKLQKGDSVNIIGEVSGEEPGKDFYKITPPEGATVWIRADMVNRGNASTVSSSKNETIKKEGIEVVPPGKLAGISSEEIKSAATTRPVIEPPKWTTTTDESASLTGVSETYRGPLRRIETLIEAQKIKPRPAQDFKPIINELKPIAEQNEDIIAQTWAKARTNQLQNYIERSDALVAMESLKATAFSDAAEIARQRDEQRRLRGEWEINPIAARGQIEASALYTGTGGQPKRWRLVDPKTGRGIAYLELPKNSSIDPVQYYGKYVGIEAISYELQRGTVPPLPIYMVKNIRVMDPNTPSDPIIYRESIGGPLVPASQPASQQPATTSPVLDGSGEPAQ